MRTLSTLCADTVNPVHYLQVYTFWIYQHLVNLGSYELDLSVYRCCSPPVQTADGAAGPVTAVQRRAAPVLVAAAQQSKT